MSLWTQIILKQSCHLIVDAVVPLKVASLPREDVDVHVLEHTTKVYVWESPYL